MPARATLVDLRKLLAERFPAAPPPRSDCLPTGLALLDDAIEGGLPKSAITEIASPHVSAGSASLIAALLRRAQHDRYFIALVDGRDSFDVEPIDNAMLRHLLWVRCGKARQAMQAADILLRDGNFPLVIVDLVMNPAAELRKISQTSWYRLQRLVESAPTACLVMTRHTMVSSAQLKIVLENAWTLNDVDAEEALLQLHFRVQRSHLQHVDVKEAEAVAV